MSKTPYNYATTAAIEQVDVSAYTIPTDAPESDGAYAWDSITRTCCLGKPDERQRAMYDAVFTART